jgi:hypothetical protein
MASSNLKENEMKKSRFLIAAAAACILAGSAAFAQQSPGTLSYASSIAGVDTGQPAAAPSINQERSIGNISVGGINHANGVGVLGAKSDIGGIYVMATKTSGVGVKLGFTEQQPRLASTSVVGLKAASIGAVDMNHPGASTFARNRVSGDT